MSFCGLDNGGHFILSYKPITDRNKYSSYVQIFRDGRIEAVDENLLRPSAEGDLTLSGVGIEREIINQLSRVFKIYKSLEVSPPLFSMLSLVGVAGYRMTLEDAFFTNNNYPIDKDNLLIPEIYVENIEKNPADIFKPAFDSIWNAAGRHRSPSYDKEGNWKP